eukprot:425759-Prorocentrum_minimum.AAC.3
MTTRLCCCRDLFTIETDASWRLGIASHAVDRPLIPAPTTAIDCGVEAALFAFNGLSKRILGCRLIRCGILHKADPRAGSSARSSVR